MSTREVTSVIRWKAAFLATIFVLPFVVLFQVAASLNGWESLACALPVWFIWRQVFVNWYRTI